MPRSTVHFLYKKHSNKFGDIMDISEPTIAHTCQKSRDLVPQAKLYEAPGLEERKYLGIN